MITIETLTDDRIESLQREASEASDHEMVKICKKALRVTYITKGSVRGSCGHKHTTHSGAYACLKRDQEGCASQGGYSDRDLIILRNEEAMERVCDALNDAAAARV